jgi:ketosteroid isomerase-like protein
MQTMSENVTPERRKMVVDLFHAIDSQDIDGLLSFLAPEATQRFGNQEPLRGHDEIRAAHEVFYGTIQSMSHETVGLWEWDGTVAVRVNATYVRLDGEAVTLPAVALLRESDGLIVEYEVFVDMAPVYV